MTLIFQSEPVACYGNSDLTIEGVALSSLGVVDCFLFVEPAWLSCPAGRGLEAILGTSKAAPMAVVATSRGPLGAPSEWPLPWLWYVVHPDSGITPGDYDGMTVQVTGHYDDPAAQNCRIIDDYSNEVTEAEAIEICRATFVVTRMEPSAH